MIRVLALALGFSALTAAVACGGTDADPDRLLQLGGGQFTERESRAGIEQSILDDVEHYETVCAALDGLSDEEAVEAFVLLYSTALPPEQEIVLADEKRLVQIMREECEAAGLG